MEVTDLSDKGHIQKVSTTRYNPQPSFTLAELTIHSILSLQENGILFPVISVVLRFWLKGCRFPLLKNSVIISEGVKVLSSIPLNSLTNISRYSASRSSVVEQKPELSKRSIRRGENALRNQRELILKPSN